MPHPWEPWVDVQTGLAPAYRPGPVPLKVTTLSGSPDESMDVQAAVRSLLVGFAFAALAAFHGYRRNDSVFWGLAWAAGGFVCPIVTLPIAVSQGFATRKVKA